MVALKETGLVLGFGGYAISGPVVAAWRRFRPAPVTTVALPPGPDDSPDDSDNI